MQTMNSFNYGFGDLKQFIMDNKIVTTSAGVCIALAAKEAIQSLVGDIIIPLVVMMLKSIRVDALTTFLPVSDKTQLNMVSFAKQVVTFVLVVPISFLFVKYAFGYMLGVRYTHHVAN